jgi:hypothetical protein
MMWMTWWPFGPVVPTPATTPGRPVSSAQLLSLARHPSADPARLRTAVSGMSRRLLRQSWESSSQALAVARSEDAVLAVVRLREALLDEMETRHPRTFTRWYGGPRQL